MAADKAAMTAIVDMTVSESRPRAYRRLLLAASVGLTLTGLAATQTVQAVATPMAVLDQARDFLDAHPTVRFTGDMTETFDDSFVDDEDTTATTNPDGLGSTSTSKSRTRGEIDSKNDALHALDDAGGDGASEMIQVDRVMYSRFADSVAELPNEKWAKFDLAALSEGMSAPASQEESDLSGVLKFAAAPQRVTRDGNVTTIAVELDPVKMFGEGATKFLKSISAKLAVADGGEVRWMQLDTKGTDFVSSARMTFADWGAPVVIVAPSDDQVDATPDTNEEAIAAWKDAPLYMPDSIPEGWVMDYADVIDAEDTAEGCAQVELDFEPPGGAQDEDAPYLYLYELPTPCADDSSGSGMAAFRAGPYTGVIDTDKDGISLAQIAVDSKTTIQADTSLTPAELATVLSRLRPLDLTVTPSPLMGVGGTQTKV
jgi:hypothetical protein